MKLRWTQRARRDLVGIGRYIARDKPMAAQRWVSRLRQRAQRAAKLPMAGRRVPEIGREDVREVFLKGYRIVYLIGEADIWILTVFEGHKLLDEYLITEFGNGSVDEQ